MITTEQTATVFGGTGFIGTQIVRELAKRGVRIKVATRVPERAYDLKPCGAVGQIVGIACDYRDEVSIANAVAGSDIVINCIGVLYQRGKSTFDHAHTDIPAMIAKACKTHKVLSFIHISALGCDIGTSRYAASKLAGEKAVKKAFKNVTILRPSVVFGENDNFFNMFAGMVQIMPSFVPLPLIGGGKTMFQPVFVGDIADAAMVCLDHHQTQGKIFELGGTQVLDFKEIYQKLFHYIGQKQPLIKLPFWLAKCEAFFLQFWPTPLLTPDQVESLKTNTVVSDKALTFDDLGLNPTDMDLILPTYLERYRPGGRFSTLNART